MGYQDDHTGSPVKVMSFWFGIEGKIRGQEVQDTSCRGFGGVPHLPSLSPQEWGAGGLKELFSRAKERYDGVSECITNKTC